MSCDSGDVKGGDALQSGPLCRMLRDKRGQFAPSRLQIGDPGSIGSHIRLGQLQSRRLELEHIRVAMRRVSKGAMVVARRLGIGELSGGRADGGAIVAPPCMAPALAKVSAAPDRRLTRDTHLWQAKIPHILKAGSGGMRRRSSGGGAWVKRSRGRWPVRTRSRGAFIPGPEARGGRASMTRAQYKRPGSGRG